MYGNNLHGDIAEAEMRRVNVEALRGAIVKALAKAGLPAAEFARTMLPMSAEMARESELVDVVLGSDNESPA
ncbi:hypothetical protein OC844_007879 [Tilletia horrida]|nr:hypothetical protein OC844_007879 [Tilletia horrida]